MEKIVESWKKNAKSNYDVNHTFLKNKVRGKAIDQEVSALHQEVFAEIDCLKCANCCKTTPALVTRPDAKRIAKHLKIPPKTFIRQYLIEDIGGDLLINGVPCTFLNEDNTCKIYEVRPQACREYPHTDQTGFGNRATMNAKNTIVCPAAHEIVQRLKNIIPT